MSRPIDPLRATGAHLAKFETALSNLEGATPATKRSKLQQLEIGKVRALAESLRIDLVRRGKG